MKLSTLMSLAILSFVMIATSKFVLAGEKDSGPENTIKPVPQRQQQQQQQNWCGPDQFGSSFRQIVLSPDHIYSGTGGTEYPCYDLYPEPKTVKTDAIWMGPLQGHPVVYFIGQNETVGTQHFRKDGSEIRIGCGNVARKDAISFVQIQAGESALLGYSDRKFTIVVCQPRTNF